jgi:hypothetical protein
MTATGDDVRARAVDALFGAFAALALGGAFLLRPSAGGLAWPGGHPLGVACPFRLATGIDCPFCGLGRSFVALARGRLVESLAWHPGGPLLALALAAVLVAVAVVSLRRRPPISLRPRFLGLARGVALAVAAAGALRWLT